MQRHNWKDKNEQRRFIEYLAKKFEIKSPPDWGYVTKRIIVDEGGSGFLMKHNNSFFQSLQTLFPEIKWKREWFFQRSKWTELDYQRKFLRDFSIKNNIKEPKDWGYISHRSLFAAGGRGILTYYERSLLKMLKGVFSDIPWRKEWFPRVQTYKFSYWDSIQNQKRFMFEIEAKLGISEPKDWKRITANMLKSNGGHGLLAKYNDSMRTLLRGLYPEEKWMEIELERNTSRKQEQIQQVLTRIFADEHICSNFRDMRVFQ